MRHSSLCWHIAARVATMRQSLLRVALMMPAELAERNEKTLLCPHCRTSNRGAARYCLACGREIGQLPGEQTPANHSQIVVARAGQARDVTESGAFGTDVTTRRTSEPGSADDTVENRRLSVRHEPLPEGTRVGGRYIIRRRLEPGPRQFRYEAEDTSSDAPYGPSCVIKESGDPGAFTGEMLALHHLAPGPGLRPPYDAFTERIGGVRRVFVVGASGQAPTLRTLSTDPEQAAAWGATLARALAFLHERQIVFGSFSANGVLVDHGRPYLADFANCALPGSGEVYSRETRELASFILQMLDNESNREVVNRPPLRLQQELVAIALGKVTVSAAELADLLQAPEQFIAHLEHLALQVGHATDVGRARTLNEDSLLVMDLYLSGRNAVAPLGLFVVADGLGGHEAGEVASEILVQSIAQKASQDLLSRLVGGLSGVDLGQWLVDALQIANTAVYERAGRASLEMGTTVVAALVSGRRAIIAHVGDSRAYHIHESGMVQLTVDHSLVESLVAAGLIRRDEARHHPQANVIVRTIGDEPSVEVDVTHVDLKLGDTLLLCSDGLTNLLDDTSIWQLVNESPSPPAACRALIAAANQAGGDDNATVILIRLESSASVQPGMGQESA